MKSPLPVRDGVNATRLRLPAEGPWETALDYMLHRFSRDLGSLMELLTQLDGYALQTQRAITIPLIRSMLENE